MSRYASAALASAEAQVPAARDDRRRVLPCSRSRRSANIADEQRLGRLLDYAVIVPRWQRLYEWSAVELGEPRLLEFVRDGNPIYAWPFEQRHVWRSPHMPPVGRALERATRSL